MPANNQNGPQFDTDPKVDPFGAHYFSLEIDTDTIAHFREASGLKASTEVFEIEAGGNVGYTHKRPGYTKWENIVLKRGVTVGSKFIEWRNTYMYAPDAGWEKRSMSAGAIVLRGLDGNEIRRYTFNQAWPVSWEGPSLSSGGSDLAIETLEIAHEGLEITTPQQQQQQQQGSQGGSGSGGSGSGSGGSGGSGGGGGSSMTQNEGPRFTAGLFGHNLTQGEALGGAELIVEEHVDMISSMRARIVADSFPWSDVKIGDPATGGFGGNSEVTFTGIVTGFRHFAKGGVEMVEIQALDPQIKLSSSRATKIWEESTDSDIASAVISDGGVDAGTVDSTSTTHKYVLQRNESNLTFLKRLAARNGYILAADKEGKIDFKKPQFSGSALEFGRADLQAFEYTISHQEIPTGVTVYGWDYVAKEKVEGTASSGDVEAIGGGANGVAETGTIWKDDLYVTDVWVTDAAAAKDMAVAELNQLARSFVRGRGVLPGTGKIRAGVLVKFKEFAEGFNPEGFVVGTRHRIQAGVYTTEFFFASNTKPT